jgi:hypothetical protein
MDTAIRIWRALVWILGGVFILPSAFLLWKEITDSEARGYYASIALSGLYFLASVLGPIGAIGLKRMSRWARPVGWIAASIQTLAIPLFTPLGLFGLVLLSSGTGKTGTRPASAQPFPWAGSIAWAAIAVLALSPLGDGPFRWAKHLGYPDAPGPAIALPILWACVLLQLAIHEVGHALAVKFVRGHIHRFQIGPLWWRRESGRNWMRFSWKSWLAGSVAWTPGFADQLARQRLFVTAGGPLANLVSGSIALAAFPWLGKLGLPNAWTEVMFFCLSGFILLANLWPTRKGYQASDGATIHGLLTNASFRRLTEITLSQSMSDSSALRPKEWSRTNLEWTLALEDVVPFTSHRSDILQAAWAHYLDSGDFSEAVRSARRFHDLAREQPKRCSPNGFPEAVFILTFYGGDLESARDLWARRPARALVQFELAERLASAAIATEDRQAAIRRAWECSELYGSCGTLEYLREQLRRLETGSLASTPIGNAELDGELALTADTPASCPAPSPI